jgi:CelD/BcsL family acetyltransferase involved in cellulose biosynthesis
MYTDLTGSFENYLKGIPPKERSTLQRKVRKIFADFPGKVTFRCYCTPEELREFHPLARTVSAKTYQDRLLKKGLPDTPEFRAEMFELALRDSVRAFLLLVDLEPIAYLYSPANGSVLFFEHLGYDANYSNRSPGTVLQYLAFEELFQEKRFEIFDFEEGEGQLRSL